MQQPNFLIICSDEHRRDALGCMGHKIVKTPYLDKLASDGTIFSNAYTPSPMCVPARAALACGKYVHQTGYWDSATPYDGRYKSWMADLRDQQVNVSSIGKLHFRSSEDDNGYTEEILPMHVVGGVGWTIGLLRENPVDYDVAGELAEEVGVGRSSYTDYDLAITAAAEKWIAESDRKSEPWSAFISLVSPHYPLVAPEEFYNLYDPAEMDMPVAYDPSDRPSHSELKNVSNFFKYDDYFDEKKMREAKVAYYGLTSFMDHCVGRILSSLEASGQRENTIILYISDHGDMMGDHGFWTKQVMYEASAGVPMIMAGPGVKSGYEVKTAVNLIDIAPTAREIFGLKHDAGLPGKSLLQIHNEADDLSRITFSEYHDGGSTTGTFMVRWDRWKYFYYVGHNPQLFDLQSDPDELNDLVANEAVQDIQSILDEGERRLRKICDPEAVNQQCFSDQRQKIEKLGGEEACATAYVFNHTPTPELDQK